MKLIAKPAGGKPRGTLRTYNVTAIIGQRRSILPVLAKNGVDACQTTLRNLTRGLPGRTRLIDLERA